MAAATAFGSALGLLLLLEVADLFDFLLPGETWAPPLQWIVLGLGGFWAYDRYAASGESFGLIGRGAARMLERDLVRESNLESASFVVGYLLGLPCCPFAPTAYKPLEMLKAAGGEMDALHARGSARLVDRVLIWLLAPVALEAILYRETVGSNPALGATFIGAARRKEGETGVDFNDGGWADDDEEERVRWAYAEALSLLKKYSGLREALAERMAAGVSVGDSVGIIEDRLKNTWVVI